MNFLFLCSRGIMHTRRPILRVLPSFGKGRAMAVAVSRRPFTMEARDKSQDSPRGICGGPSETGTAFPPIITLSSISIVHPLLHIYIFSFICHRRTRWCSWLRNYTTSGKVTGPFPDGDIGIFHSGRTVALGSTQTASNINEYQEYFVGCKVGLCVGLTNLPPSCAGCHEIWEPQTPGNLRACPDLYRDCFTFYK